MSPGYARACIVTPYRTSGERKKERSVPRAETNRRNATWSIIVWMGWTTEVQLGIGMDWITPRCRSGGCRGWTPGQYLGRRPPKSWRRAPELWSIRGFWGLDETKGWTHPVMNPFLAWRLKLVLALQKICWSMTIVTKTWPKLEPVWAICNSVTKIHKSS